MKTVVLAAATLVGASLSPSLCCARVHASARVNHQHVYSDVAPASLRSERQPTFRTVQPTDDGRGILAPNGYRGPGSATGGPAGGIDDGGP